MAIKIIIITHGRIGEAILTATTKTYGELPIPTKLVPVYYNSSLEKVTSTLHNELSKKCPSDNILILTDLVGSTPTNMVMKIKKDPKIKIVSGLNLPMLIRVMNYPNLPLDALVEKAIDGGKTGVTLCE